MLCENCGKNEANVHITRNINGHITEMNLCSECAKKTGNMPEMRMDSIFSDFFSSVMPARARRITPWYSGRLSEYAGCEDCIESPDSVFSDKTETEQEKNERKINDLRMQLKQAVETEEYEKAAQLRDEIRDLEKHDHKA